jgi:D-glycero-D-manno-heptose 1,7-bisphosphate phosphatase
MQDNKTLLAVIMAGGQGTRLSAVSNTLPKPMVRVCGKPILEHQIEYLRTQGLTRVLIIVGYRGQTIKDYFNDGSILSPVTHKPFGVNISYIVEKEPLGTAGALYLLKNELYDDLLILNGDLILDVDLSRFLAAHQASGALASILTHANDHPYDSGLIETDSDGFVTKWCNKEDKCQWYRNRVNAGLHILKSTLLDRLTSLIKLDLDRDVLQKLIPAHELFAYDSPEYIKDVGTPERLQEAIRDVEKGLVSTKNLIHPQKAVFLDRDGTINRYDGFLTNPDRFTLLPGAAEAIKRINHSGYLAIVITNQPVIARGETTWQQLDEIHRKMETLLGREGAYLDGIYVCPHHPDSGFMGELIQYKVECDCRKPKPGLLLQAAKDYNIDLRASYMVGDSWIDAKAGLAAGTTAVLLESAKHEEIIGHNGVETYKNLALFASALLQERDVCSD